MSTPHEITPEDAWEIVEPWIPQAIQHVRGTLQRIAWDLEAESSWDTSLELRRRVMDGAAEHECEMFRPENQSLSRFHRELREELLDAIVYAAMSERHLVWLKLEEKRRSSLRNPAA